MPVTVETAPEGSRCSGEATGCTGRYSVIGTPILKSEIIRTVIPVGFWRKAAAD